MRIKNFINVMKKLLLLLPLVSLLFLMSSCDSDNVTEPEPVQAMSKCTMNIKLHESKSSISDPTTGEVLLSSFVDIEEITHLMLVVHMKDVEGEDDEDEKYVCTKELFVSDFKIEDGAFIWENLELPSGSYYFTLIAHTANSAGNIMKLSEKYSKAAYQIPPGDVFYKTMEIDLIDNSDINVKDIILDRLTSGTVVYATPEWGLVPKDAKVEVKIEFKDQPSAFYLKTGKTFTNKEHEDYSFEKYNTAIVYDRIQDKQLLAAYPLLRNYLLEDSFSERGVAVFTVKINDEIVNNKEMKMPLIDEAVNSGAITLMGLYAEN